MLNKIILENFRNFLVSKTNVKEISAPYYLRWISSCYTFCNLECPKTIPDQQKQEFLKEFARKHEDWQVKQAEEALRLFEYFNASGFSRLNLSP